MTTETPSTRGEGVDVIGRLRDEMSRLGDKRSIRMYDTIERIAELIEAADLRSEFADGTNEKYRLVKQSDLDHLAEKVAACRATPGAHR